MHLRSGQSGQELWISDDLPFGFLAGDYAGNDCLETADLYRRLLEDGV